MAHNGGNRPNRKTSNPQRKVRRARNKSKQLERKIRHILKRSGYLEAQAYAKANMGGTAILERIETENAL